MKKPLYDQYDRELIINCPDSFMAAHYNLRIATHKCFRSLFKDLDKLFSK